MEPQNFEKLSITLPGEMARLIHQRVSTGEYGSASEVIREAMRAWMQREKRLAALDAAIVRGVRDLEAGLGQDAETVRQELKRRRTARSRRRT